MKLIRMLRLIRLVKLVKLLKFEEFIDAHEDGMVVSREVLTLLKLMTILVFLGHLVACAWFAIAQSADQDLRTWAAVRFNSEHPNSDKWKTDLPLSTKYTASLYWAITTMATVGSQCFSCTAN